MPNYSSKHYAEVSRRYAEGTPEEVQALGVEKSAKDYNTEAKRYAEEAEESATKALPPPLLSFTWQDHLLNDINYVRADTFSWQDAITYSEAYEHLVADLIDGVSSVETVGSNSITVYTASDGHKVVQADMEATVQAIFAETGIAWYYIVDTVNRQFKLPRSKWGFVGLRDAVGNYVQESLPDHLHNLSVNGTYDGTSGFYGTAGKADYAQAYTAKTQLASATSPVYGGTEVQQRATQMYLYFYVGQFSKTATEQTAGITAETLNGKADLDLGNLPQTVKGNVSGWGMPSNEYIDLTLGPSDSTYTAPANGYMLLTKMTTGSQNIQFFVNGTDKSTCDYMTCMNVSTNGTLASTWIPVKKDDVITYHYTAGGALTHFRFIYAQGEI